MSLKSKGSTRSEVRYHFVFTPKYRKRVLKGKIKKRIDGMIRFACQINDWEIIELAVDVDHVHLYLQVWPKDSPSSVMNKIKGGTARKIRKIFPDLEEVFWGASFWADGYLVKTAGSITDKVISNYIKQHR